MAGASSLRRISLPEGDTTSGMVGTSGSTKSGMLMLNGSNSTGEVRSLEETRVLLATGCSAAGRGTRLCRPGLFIDDSATGMGLMRARFGRGVAGAFVFFCSSCSLVSACGFSD